MINYNGVHKLELLIRVLLKNITSLIIILDRPIGSASFTMSVQAVEASGNRDCNLLIFISKKPATSF